ncbi:MAG TPA: adenylosuccinate lyase [Candidatus Polarisedimenticolia bacterium]|nr:adenylosuccinate lyase [Candidatus Polarisedimenticolia bacterium]
MIARYTLPGMGRVWEEENKLACWLKVEIAVCEAMADLGMIPCEAAAAVKARAAVDPARVAEIEAAVRHDVIAFLTAVGEKVGEPARYMHLGMTSSDMLDTATALQMVQACDLLLDGVRRLREVLERRAREFRRIPMVGRTHGIHAEPTTFGLKMALWYDEMGRNLERLQRARETVRVGKISGAVGTFAHLPPAVEERVCARLGLRPAPISTQILQRDLHAELLWAIAATGASLEKFAVELRHLQRTEVREAEEPFAQGQKGSSAMPHKRNPVLCEQITGLARLLRSHLVAGLEDVALWHERDISHSSVERVILPDAAILLHYMLDRFTAVADGMRVDPQRMRANLESTRGLVFSGTLLLAVTRKGSSREEAYAAVQEAAMRCWETGEPLRELVLKDARITARLTRQEIDEAFDLDHHLRHVDAIFERVFA